MEILNVVANLLFLNFISARIASKCCPQNYELWINNSSYSEISLENVSCRLTDSAMLVDLDPLSSVIGLPNCSILNIIDIFRKDVKISCQDRIHQLNDIYAIRCAKNESENLHEIASLSSLRKCCPTNRKYNWDKQYCWNRYAENYANSAIDLVRLTTNRVNQFVNLSLGLPHCRKSDVLLDRITHRDRVEFLNTDALEINDSNDSFILSFDEFCVDLVDDRFEYLVIRYCQDYIVACKQNKRVCIRKCCPVGYELDGEKCRSSFRPLAVSFYNLTQKYSSEVVAVNAKSAFYQGNPCTRGKYGLRDDDGDEKHILMTDGTIFMPVTNTVMDINAYCVDNVRFQNKTRTFVCVHENKTVLSVISELKPVLTSICAGISAFFLLLTFFIYLSLPSLRNLHGQLIMCYLIASATSYIMIIVHRTVLLQKLSADLCVIAGYLMLFTTLSSFCWLNIISYDIWSTFKIAKSSFLKKSKTCRRLLLYSLYGWGYPLLWSGVVACSSYIFNTVETTWISDISSSSCWFSDYGISKIIYFVAPISIMIIFNAIIFVIIVKYCSNIRAELNNTNNCNYTLRKYTVNKNRLIINIKLFVLMGLNWGFEIIALVVQPHHRIFFIISDLFNALIGLIIFCILIVKWKVLYDLKKRICEGKSRQGLDHMTRSNLSTSSSNLQSIMNSRRSVSNY